MADWAAEAIKNIKPNGIGIAPNGLNFRFNEQVNGTYRYYPFIQEK